MKSQMVFPGGLTKEEFVKKVEENVRLNDLYFVCQPSAVEHVAFDLMRLGVPRKNFFTVGADEFGDGEKRFYVSHEDEKALKKAASLKKPRFVILTGTRPFKQADDWLDAFFTLEAAQPVLPTKRTIPVCTYAAYLRGHRKTKDGKGGRAFASEPLAASALVDSVLQKPFGSKYCIVTPHTVEKGILKKLLKPFYPMGAFVEAARRAYPDLNVSLFAPDEEASITVRAELDKAMGRKVNTAFVRKFRGAGVDETEAEEFVGDVSGTNVLCFDDLTSTGGSLERTVKKSLEQGAKGVMVGVTHMVTLPALVRLLESKADHVVFTNSIDLNYLLSTDRKLSKKATQLARRHYGKKLKYVSIAPAILSQSARILAKRK